MNEDSFQYGSDFGESIKQMVEAINAAKTFEMPDLTVLKTMPKYPTKDFGESIKQMVEAINAAKTFEITDLTVLAAMPKYSTFKKNNIKVNNQNQSNFATIDSAQEDNISLEFLKNELEILKKEVYDVTLSDKEKQSKIEHLYRLVNPTIRKKILIFILGSLFSLILSPIDSYAEDQFKKGLIYIYDQYIKTEEEIYIEKIFYDKIDENYRSIDRKSILVKIYKHNQSETLGYMYKNQIVEITKQKKDWTKIYFDFPSEQTMEGWVYTRYLTKLI